MWMNLVNTTLWKIFAYLPYYKIIHAGQVCRRWHALSLDDLLWKLVLIRHFNIATPITLRHGAKSWRQEFIRMIDEVPSVLTDLPDHHRQEAMEAVDVSFAHTKNMFSVCYLIRGFVIWSASYPCSRLFSVDNDVDEFEFNERIQADNSQFNLTDELLLVYGTTADCGSDHRKISIYKVGLEISEQICLVMSVPTEDFGVMHNFWVTETTFLSFCRRKYEDDNDHMEVYLNNINPVDVVDGYNNANGGDVDNREVKDLGEDGGNREIGENNVAIQEEDRNNDYEGNEVHFNTPAEFIHHQSTWIYDILTSNWEDVGIFSNWNNFVVPIKNHQDDTPNLLITMGLVTFEVPDYEQKLSLQTAYTGIGLLKKVDSSQIIFDVEDLEVLYLRNEDFERMAILGYCMSPDQRTCYFNARPIAANQDFENFSHLGQLDVNENLQVIPLDLTSMTFGSALIGHKGLPELNLHNIHHSLFEDVSRDYIGCGSEVDGGYLWDRHYGCLVSVLKSKHEEHKAVKMLEEKLKDDLDEEEDLTLPLKKMTLYLEKDHEDKEYTAPCGCGYLLQRGSLPQNEEEEVKAVKSVAIEPVNQNIMVTASRRGRIKVFRSRKWIRENGQTK